MNLSEIREYFAQKRGSYEDFPFDESTLVIKVKDKMFALIGLDEDPLRINLKCDPVLAVELRQIYSSVIPGYHMNKTHWNTVILDGSIPQEVLLEMIDHSYQLVFDKLTKKKKNEIKKNLLS